MSSSDSNPDSDELSLPLRRKAQARDALLEFAETSGELTGAALSAFGPARGARSRAQARRIRLPHFVAHVLALATAPGLLGVGLLHSALGMWSAQALRTPLFAVLEESSQGAFYAVLLVLALCGTALSVLALYLLSRIAAPRRERQRFIAALPSVFRPGRPVLLVGAWVLCALAFAAWRVSGT
ncbi:MAG: hypothetical protein ABI364_00315 [Caldimonas sp.]